MNTNLTFTASARASIQPSDGADDSEDDEVYGGAKGRAFAKKHRKLQAAASGSGTPNMGDVRFSTRRGGKVTNYNDDDNFGISEDDLMEEVPESYYTYEPTGPAIDLVLNHRRKEGVGTCQFPSCDVCAKADHLKETEDPTKKDYEYFVC